MIMMLEIDFGVRYANVSDRKDTYKFRCYGINNFYFTYAMSEMIFI